MRREPSPRRRIARAGRAHLGGGSTAARQQHESRGKMFVRDRIDRLLDPARRSSRSASWPATSSTATGSRPRLWSRALAASSGVECMIVGNDATVKAAPTTRSRSGNTCGQGHRPREPAAVRVPGGLGRSILPAPGRRVPDREHFGRILLQPRRRCPLSGSAARGGHGSCTAAAPTCPRCATRRSSLREQGTIFLGGRRWYRPPPASAWMPRPSRWRRPRAPIRRRGPPRGQRRPRAVDGAPMVSHLNRGGRARRRSTNAPPRYDAGELYASCRATRGTLRRARGSLRGW